MGDSPAMAASLVAERSSVRRQEHARTRRCGAGPSQISGQVPKYLPSRKAVSAEIARLPLTMPASFAMTMLTSTAGGDAYTLSELTSMYGQAGLGSVTAHPIPMSPHTIVMGRA